MTPKAFGLTALLALGAATAADAQTTVRSPQTADPCAAAVNRNEPDPLNGLGCATESNLKAMIANPADLARGQTPSAPQGDGAFLASERYRRGQTKPLSDGQASGGPEGAGGQPSANNASR